jgi:N-acetylmuramoyl-L-alanine amidase
MKIKILLLQVMVLILLSAVIIQGANHRDYVEAISKLGNRGDEVRLIQTKLQRWGYYDGSVDGIYGPQTKKAVEYFQRTNNLAVDGIAGPETLKAMGIMGGAVEQGEETPPNNGGSSNQNSNDRNLLARVINGEARGEPFEGQVAVGAVVLNRVNHPSFPGSIPSVVYQPGAFTAINDGQINAQMYESSYRAADLALSGMDPTNGCIYYYNPKTATNQWIRSRPVLKIIGKHVFAK